MKLNLQKPIVFFDLETTGLDIVKDRIVEISMIKLNQDGSKDEFYSLVNPGNVMVSKEAEEKHGISNEKVANEPTFKDISKNVYDFISDCDLGGYNIHHFDVPFLTEELGRSGIFYNPLKCNIVDVYKLVVKNESRNLETIYQRFTGKVLENAHSAKADVEATIEIFDKQIDEYQLPEDVRTIHESIIENNNNIDFAGKFKRVEDKGIVITFGKHKDKSVQEVMQNDPGYLKWMTNADFPTNTKVIASKLIEKLS